MKGRSPSAHRSGKRDKREGVRGPRTKDTLRELNVRPTKERGQNFLIQEDVPVKIVEFGAPPKEANVVEIGPGTGALTKHLSQWSSLTLIEIEERFCAPLQQAYPHVKIINQDVRQVDLYQVGSNLVVFGNIPYSFSTDIVFHLLECRQVVQYAVLMVQKEFAQRLAADHGSRTYGSLSVAVQQWADVTLGPIVPGNAFHPPTQVESQVVKLRFRETPRVEIDDAKHFERVVRASFSQRRKKLTNSLAASTRWSREEVEEALGELGIRLDARPEQLSVEQFGQLAHKLSSTPLPKAEG